MESNLDTRKNGLAENYVQFTSDFFFFFQLRRMGKTHLRVSDICRLSVTNAPVATAARAVTTGRMSMSPRPDPERSSTEEITTRRCPRLRVVWNLRELTRCNTFSVAPSLRTSIGGKYSQHNSAVWLSDTRASCGGYTEETVEANKVWESYREEQQKLLYSRRTWPLRSQIYEQYIAAE